MSKRLVIHWFRQDLRISDNPALYAANKAGHIMPIFILDKNECSINYKQGAASNCWLHYSLESLNIDLNYKLNIYIGNPIEVLTKLAIRYSVDTVFWNRCYDNYSIRRDNLIKEELKKVNVQIQAFNSLLLLEPWENLNFDNKPYRVFTFFYKKSYLKIKSPRKIISKPKNMFLVKDLKNQKLIYNLKLLPKINWFKKIKNYWIISENGAYNVLRNFLNFHFKNYKEGRNFPEENHISRLSPYLHHGNISISHIWNASYKKAQLEGWVDSLECFHKELVWREFSYSTLFHFPKLPYKNFQEKFNKFPWKINSILLKSWQKGQTGYPIIDAGMRELWETGYMHNRIRMITSSFLVKNLLLDWRIGAAWFWNCLVDADLANNSASWQWIAGCGADAAPYFRIFNPVIQSKKFDPNGQYIRKYIPEISQLSNQYLFEPWKAPQEVLKAANIKLGINYPVPIVDLKESRISALQALKMLN